MGKKDEAAIILSKKKELEHQEYEHRACLQMMIKSIWVSSIHEQVKVFMTLRIWGASPRFFAPLKIDEVAKKLLGHAPSLKEIIAFIEMERYGKATVQEFVANMSQQDIVNRFNEDYSKNMNHMFAGGSKGCEHGKGSFTI